MPVTKWNGDTLLRAIDAEMGRRLEAGLLICERHAKELVSQPGPGPSAPGEPPHMQSGRGRGSITHERQGLVGRYGTNVTYMRLLDLGTGTTEARPWLRRSFAERRDALVRLFTRPMF